jgi:O-Antigen ligase
MAVKLERRVLRPSMPRPWRERSNAWIVLAIGAVVFLVAYDQAGFALGSRAAIAIAAWWAILLGLGLSIWPRMVVSREARAVGCFLGALALWTFASIFWADSAERAFAEFNRAAMFLGIFLVAVFAGTRATLGRWADGLALGVVVVAVFSLVSRLFPSTFSEQGFPVFLPGAVTRLSFPLGYWNGLGAFVGFAFPLCLGIAARADGWLTRVVAVGSLPWVTAVVYLTSSRGGVAVAVIGTIAFLAATSHRTKAFGAVVIAILGSVASIAVLVPRHELVDGPIDSSTAASQGRSAFVLMILICFATGSASAVGGRLLRDARVPMLAGRFAATALAIAAVAVLLLSHPIHRFDTFKQLPGAGPSQQHGFVRAHLLSGSGSGRWQFWTAAYDEWKSAPIIGRGAGSYQGWWAEHASFSYFVRNAHSLYLEVLAELGIVGFLLLIGAFGYGGFVAARSTLRLRDEERIASASLLGVLVAFYVAAGVEWVWQLTVVSALAMLCLGLLSGPASVAASRQIVGATRHQRNRLPRFAVGAVSLVVVWAVICAQALPWLTDLELKRSANEAANGNGDGALHRATIAKRLEPWAASPYLQLALVQEQRAQLQAAEESIRAAIKRDSTDWRLWLVAARIETKAGEVASARRSLLRAKALNPRSPLFSGM